MIFKKFIAWIKGLFVKPKKEDFRNVSKEELIEHLKGIPEVQELIRRKQEQKWTKLTNKEKRDRIFGSRGNAYKKVKAIK